MRVSETSLPGVLLVEPKAFGDERGFFFESWNQRAFDQAVGAPTTFVQDNHSRSAAGVLRGLHYQVSQPQGKLVRVIAGSVFDVAVDIRPGSATFGKWYGCELSAQNRRQLWIPPGLAHGFLVTSEHAEFLYKTTEYWLPAQERTIRWDDAALAIGWPLKGEPTLSEKDRIGLSLADAEPVVTPG